MVQLVLCVLTSSDRTHFTNGETEAQSLAACPQSQQGRRIPARFLAMT